MLHHCASIFRHFAEFKRTWLHRLVPVHASIPLDDPRHTGHSHGIFRSEGALLRRLYQLRFKRIYRKAHNSAALAPTNDP